MQNKKAHPINIIESTPKFFLLLIFPLLRGLFALRGDVISWLKGSWLDILVILAIFALSFANWYFLRFSVTDSGLLIEKGFIFRRTTYIAFSQISAVTKERPFLLTPFKICRVFVDTDGGNLRKSDFKITLSDKDAKVLTHLLRADLKQDISSPKYYVPSSLYVLVLSFVTSNSLSGILFLATLIKQTGDFLGQDIGSIIATRLTNIVQFLAFGIPTTTAILAYVVLAGFLLSFIRSALRHYGFNAIRTQNILSIGNGLFTKREYSIAISKVNFIEIRQNLITKFLKLYSVFIHCAGYGKQRGEMSVIIPAERKSKAKDNLDTFFPEIPLCKKEIAPRPITISKFFIPPCALILSFLVIFYILRLAFPNSDTLFFLSIMVQVPSVIWLVVKIVAFFHTGAGANDDVITFYYTYSFNIFTKSIPRSKISKIVIKQTPLQKMVNCCSLVIYPYAEGKRHFTVINLNCDDVERLRLTK